MKQTVEEEASSNATVFCTVTAEKKKEKSTHIH